MSVGIKAAAAICLVVVGLMVVFKSVSHSGDVLDHENAQLVSIGATIYADHCASCHGDNLEGQANWQSRDADGYLPAPPHDETGHTWHHSDQILFDITKFGMAAYLNQDNYKSHMPVYEDILSDEEIIASLSFIKSRWPKDVQKRHDEINAYAKENQ